MQLLEIEETDVTPYVKFDKEHGQFIMMGRSLPEDVKAFYLPLIEWWNQYIKDPNPSTNLVLDFNYFNSATSKMLLLFLNRLKELQKNGNEVLVTWRYPADDFELENAGIELCELLNIPFDIKPSNTCVNE